MTNPQKVKLYATEKSICSDLSLSKMKMHLKFKINSSTGGFVVVVELCSHWIINNAGL